MISVKLKHAPPMTVDKSSFFKMSSCRPWHILSGIPKDPRPPMQTSGLRLGTPAVTTRGMGIIEMDKIAEWIDRIITSKGDSEVQDKIRKEISVFCKDFPLPH